MLEDFFSVLGFLNFQCFIDVYKGIVFLKILPFGPEVVVVPEVIVVSEVVVASVVVFVIVVIIP